MAVKWGTDSKVRFVEPTLGIPVELGASGEMNIAVSNGRKMLIKLVGTKSGIAWEEKGTGFCYEMRDFLTGEKLYALHERSGQIRLIGDKPSRLVELKRKEFDDAA